MNDQPHVHPNIATTSQQDQRIVDLFEQNPGLTLDQGREQLSRRGITASRSTIRRRLLSVAVRYRSTIKKPLLTQKHIEKRLQWATENLDTDWSKVIYTDEASFWQIDGIN